MQHKKLYRSQHNRVIAGVCGGLGEYSNIDPNAIRLIFAVVTIFTGFIPGIITYIVAVLIVPIAPTITPSTPVTDDTGAV